MHDPTVGSLFSGIGGLDLGLERAGWRVRWQCESDPYARAVLARHWPDVPCYPDVRALGDVEPVTLLCGGFPCQPVSVAGKRLAQADPRWLWPAFARVIADLRPPVVLLENVPGLRSAGLRDVLADLAELGFDAEWTIARACDLGAPHIRARLFLVATDADRPELRLEPGWFSRAARAACAPIPRDVATTRPAPDPDSLRRVESAIRIATQRGWARHCGWPLGAVERVDDGISRAMERRRCLGNAVVPQVAQWIGERLMDLTQKRRSA